MDPKFLFLSYEGRINRQPFWLAVIVLMVANGIAVAVFQSWVTGLIQLALFYPAFAVSVKRCHDRGKSGWWSLVMLIPVVGFVWAVIDLGILQGTDGGNTYGSDPLDAS